MGPCRDSSDFDWVRIRINALTALPIARTTPRTITTRKPLRQRNRRSRAGRDRGCLHPILWAVRRRRACPLLRQFALRKRADSRKPGKRPSNRLIKFMQHDDPKDRDREQSRCSRNRVVDSRGDTDPTLRHGIHHRGRERSDAHRHPVPRTTMAGKKCRPVTAADLRPQKESEARGGDQWTRHQWNFCAAPFDQAARPT